MDLWIDYHTGRCRSKERGQTGGERNRELQTAEMKEAQERAGEEASDPRFGVPTSILSKRGYTVSPDLGAHEMSPAKKHSTHTDVHTYHAAHCIPPDNHDALRSTLALQIPAHS